MAQLKGWVGGNGYSRGWRRIRTDLLTNALMVIDFHHAETHEGNGYRVTQAKATDAFDIAAPITFHVTTPNTTKWAHLIWHAEASTEALLEIFEDNGNASHFDISGGDTSVPLNNNRNSTNTSGLVVKTGVTITQATADVLIYSDYVGSRVLGGEREARQELILKQNTEYLFKFTSVADNNEGGLRLNWYEHTSLT
jgi:hypothetical protein